MIKPDKGKMVSFILEKMGPSKKVPSVDVESDSSMALHGSMEKFIEAVASKDVESAVSSLKDFIYMCEQDH